jgi:AraC-like DNA-binding protein
VGGIRKKIGFGQVYIWPGGSLWIGIATGETEAHAHHAVQVSFAESGELKFRTGKEWQSYVACAVPSDLPHAYLGGNNTVAHIFVEPESAAGARLLERFGRRAIAPLPSAPAAQAAAGLFAAWRRSRSAERMTAAAREALRQIGGEGSAGPATDPRVLKAIDTIKASLDSTVTLADVARSVCLSPSRLRRLFVQETGLTFRSYVLWQRLQRVFGMMTTTSMTEAAHAAGFADAAHMSRTFRRMMGIAPTSLEPE